MSLTDGIRHACAANGQGRHVEHPSNAVVVIPEPQKLVAVRSGVTPVLRKVGGHKINGERIMPGSDRSVRGENRGAAYLIKSVIEGLATVHQLTYSLERDERRVPLVQMPDPRLVTQNAKHPNTSK